MKLSSLWFFVRHWKLVAGIIILLITPPVAVLFQPPESCVAPPAFMVNLRFVLIVSAILLGLCLIWLDVPHGESK